jgi:CPA1 family monovalent cation:H+ antiporter
MTAPTCTHLEAIEDVEPQTPGVCGECVTEGRHTWVHLRLCLSCGNVGCCDSSVRKHATRHYETLSHPIMQSAQPGESWRWCYVDELIV